jgi:outer membrane murein-binding lipoprotein Lpp
VNYRHDRYRNRVGISFMVIVVLWAAVSAGIWGTYATMRQRIQDSSQRVVEMRAQMERLGARIESTRTQQAAMLGRDLIKERLQAAGSTLVPIRPENLRQLAPPPGGGMALGGAPPGRIEPR